MIRQWPEGKNVAVTFCVMFEGWEEGTAPGIGPMGNPLKPGFLDTANIGWGQYATNNGLERLLKVFREESITGSVCCNGIMLERSAGLIRQAALAGHEIMLHGYAQNIIPVYLDEATERAQMEKCIELITRVTGKRPVGYCSPRCTGSTRTSEILAEQGVRYTIDWMGSDLPVVEKTPKGDVCLMPFPMNINDMPISVRYGNPASHYYEALVDEFENWYGKHPEEKAVVWITAHAHVFGRPYGAIQFQKAMQYVKSLPYVWIAQPHEIASTVLDVEYR
jgi:peptidoglycan/xylan/chitin deacetylase (PgdA/CDA1 family)